MSDKSDNQSERKNINEEQPIQLKESKDVLSQGSCQNQISNITQENTHLVRNKKNTIDYLNSQFNKYPSMEIARPLDSDLPFQSIDNNQQSALTCQMENYQGSLNHQSIPDDSQINPNGIIPDGPSYMEHSNGELIMIVEHHQNKLDLNTKYRPFPFCVAITSFLLNIFLPGIGTMIASAFMSTSSFKIQYFLKGLCELITAIFIIGWGLGIYNSAIFIIAASRNLSIEEFILNP